MTAYRLGYCRTSTKQQDLGLQRDALIRAGVDPENIFEEQESGAKRDRPILAQMLKQLRPGDILVVWKLDRLARSLSHLLEVVEGLAKRGIAFRSVTEDFNTATPAGKMFFQVVGAMAEFERNLIEERRIAGIERAKAAGKQFGRKRLSDPGSTVGKGGAIAQAILAVQGGSSVNAASKAYGVGRATISRHMDSSFGQSVSVIVSGNKPQLKGHLNGHAQPLPELG